MEVVTSLPFLSAALSKKKAEAEICRPVVMATFLEVSLCKPELRDRRGAKLGKRAAFVTRVIVVVEHRN